ncbi:GntR family transcriptional regulator [Aciduricibacillus chroicocephali]|uniref:GntR family transcriptional regulator n=1 Tax=Aciduricibacillus chroicocephali TaxID=3054939 RepID=A0ABY9KWG4_9BACI|nr:GntR family transcriptional regulator [Bacillaceae bacterium 44XB]
MKNKLDDSRPIYLQIKEQLENDIMNGSLQADERIPSTNEFAQFYKINPATAAKGINELVAENILYKKRGVGMFVAEEAKTILIKKRKQTFYEDYMKPLKREAENLGLGLNELVEMIKGGESDEN